MVSKKGEFALLLAPSLIYFFHLFVIFLCMDSGCKNHMASPMTSTAWSFKMKVALGWSLCQFGHMIPCIASLPTGSLTGSWCRGRCDDGSFEYPGTDLWGAAATAATGYHFQGDFSASRLRAALSPGREKTCHGGWRGFATERLLVRAFCAMLVSKHSLDGLEESERWIIESLRAGWQVASASFASK